jgi:APA family basic amino acid/polyamine antiporter
VPRAILLSLAISTALHILVGLVAVGLVGAPALSGSGSPLTDAIRATGNPAAVYAVSVGGILATASVLLTSILGVSRIAYAMARRGDLPRTFGGLHPRYNTPYRSVWVTGAVMVGLVIAVDLSRVVAISTFALLFYYGVANLCALKLTGRGRRFPRTIPGLGVATCLILLATILIASPRSWIIGIATLLGGTVFYIVRQAETRSG